MTSSFILLLLTLFLPSNYKILSTTLIVLFSGIVILLTKNNSYLFIILTYRPVIFIGLMSYSLYLWHWSIIVISKWTIGIHWWSIPLQVSLIFFFSFISYAFVEKRFRKASIINKNKILIYGITTSILSSVFIIFLAKSANSFYLGEKPNESLASYTIPNWNVNHCVFNPNTKTQIDLSPDSCGLSNNSKNTVYLLGDSHSHQFKDPISYFATKKGLNFVNAWVQACGFPGDYRKGMSQCDSVQQKIRKDLISKVKQGDTVIISSSLYSMYAVKWNKNHSSEERLVALNYHIEKLSDLATQLKQKNVDVIVYLDSAQFYEIHTENVDTALCVEEWYRPYIPAACEIDKNEFISNRKSIFERLKILESEGLLVVWDGVENLICNDEKCSAVFMADSNHFLHSYSWFLSWQFFQSYWNL